MNELQEPQIGRIRTNYNDVANVLKQFNELLKNGIDTKIVSDAVEAFIGDYAQQKRLSIQEIMDIIERNGYSIGNGQLFDPKEYRQPRSIPFDEIQMTCDYNDPPHIVVSFKFPLIQYRGIYDSGSVYFKNDCVTKIRADRTRTTNDFYILDTGGQAGKFPANWITYPEWIKKYGK